MGENNKVLLGVLGGVLLGAFGAAVVKRGNLRPHAAKVLSYGYDIKDAIIEQAMALTVSVKTGRFSWVAVMS